MNTDRPNIGNAWDTLSRIEDILGSKQAAHVKTQDGGGLLWILVSTLFQEPEILTPSFYHRLRQAAVDLHPTIGPDSLHRAWTWVHMVLNSTARHHEVFLQRTLDAGSAMGSEQRLAWMEWLTDAGDHGIEECSSLYRQWQQLGLLIDKGQDEDAHRVIADIDFTQREAVMACLLAGEQLQGSTLKIKAGASKPRL